MRRGTQATYVFNKPEADRYELLVKYEGAQVKVTYGHAATDVGTILGELVCVAYPRDSSGRLAISKLVIREDDGMWLTLAASSVRRIFFRCKACGGDAVGKGACCNSE